jgi:hypothetical protein
MTTTTVISLDMFINEALKDVNDFESKWLELHKNDPERYPLELPVNNAGLWIEFLMNYMIGGEI